MNIVYNTLDEIASSITDFLFKSIPNIRKTQTNIIPFIVIGMILAESTVKADIKYFTSMCTIACFTSLFLTIFGADFTKNSKCYKNIKLTTHKVIGGYRKRVMSLFNIGLTLFNMAFNSLRYIRIPYTFILYDT